MQKISKKANKKNAELKILPRENTFGLIEYIQEQNRVTKIGQKFFDKYDAEKQKYRYELMPKTKFQPCRRFVRKDLAERKIRSRRLAPEQFLEFKEKLVLDPKELRNIVLMDKVF